MALIGQGIGRLGSRARPSFRSVAQESMRKMLVFFTAVCVLGLVAGLIIGIVGAVELNHALDTTPTDSFNFNTP
jgi:hypothetical protein